MRLDVYLSDKKLFKSRNKASETVKKGLVEVDGKVIYKPSYEVDPEKNEITVKESDSFVSNGGYKLQKAFDDFDFKAENLICADIGASTGGFTECLLRHGAKKVYAVDVGKSQLDETLANDERVVVIDEFNARDLCEDTFGEKVDFVTSDVSFISLTYILRQISCVLKNDGCAVVLVKPQFECGKKSLNKNGIVTNVKDRKRAIEDIIKFASLVDLATKNVTNAPVKPDKNVEYLLLLQKGADPEKIDLTKLP